MRRIAAAQGRSLTWVAAQLAISRNYLHRILMPPDDTDHRAVPTWFYGRMAQLLGVPEEMLRPPWEDDKAA